MVECLPLRSPSEGWRANWVFWIRLLLVSVIVGFGINSMMVRFIPGLNFTVAKRLTCAIGCGVLFVGTCILAVSEIAFPVPLMMQIGSIPIAFYSLLMNLLVLESALFAKDSPLKTHADRYNRFFPSIMALCYLQDVVYALTSNILSCHHWHFANLEVCSQTLNRGGYA